MNWNSFIINFVKFGEEDLIFDGWIDMLVYLVFFGLFLYGIVKIFFEFFERFVDEFYVLDLLYMNVVWVRIDVFVKDKVIVEKLKLWYNMFCKCFIFSDEYL